ncbi:MAG: leucine-rich repeat domain-containing protein [Clostridia bacterium]|nr:leucine-rich repeat domain-containing protein [Clostridia bacterium]
MKKLLSISLCVLMLLSASVMGIGTVLAAPAESSEDDFVVFDGVLEEYIGAGGDVVIPASLGIKEIASAAFIKNTDITSVVIPEGVHTIGRAFEDCTNLESVTLPYSLQQLTGGNNFANCTSLTSITIPGKLRVVPTWSFFGCTALEEIILSYGVEEIHSQAFGKVTCDVVFPETVKYIYGTAFNIQTSEDGATYTICNPNCTIGYFGGSLLDDEKHNFYDIIHPPFQCSSGKATFEIIVPEGSEIEKFITDNEDKMLNQGGEANHLDQYLIMSKPASYFEDLEENQKDFGITSSTGNSSNNDDDDDDKDTDKDSDKDSDKDDDKDSDKNSDKDTSNKNNKNDNDDDDDSKIVYENNQDNSMLYIILGIVGGVILLMIIGVVVLVIVMTKKPKAKVAAPVAEAAPEVAEEAAEEVAEETTEDAE